jgi:hypothetical protein
MQQIANQSTSHQIAPADRAALADAKNSLVGDDLTRPLAADVRGRLAKFLADTDRYATPALDSQIDDEISMLMISFKTGRTISEAEASATIVAYTQVLRGLPIWAIRQGFAKIARGEIEGVSKDFAPTAPRLRQVVTDEMVPLRADRVEVQRVLSARVGLPDNPDLARRAKEAAKSGLNAMQMKFGPNYGLGGALPANEIGAAVRPSAAEFKTMTPAQLTAHYAQHGLQFRPKPDIDRDGDRYDDRYGSETFHDRGAVVR